MAGYGEIRKMAKVLGADIKKMKQSEATETVLDKIEELSADQAWADDPGNKEFVDFFNEHADNGGEEEETTIPELEKAKKKAKAAKAAKKTKPKKKAATTKSTFEVDQFGFRAGSNRSKIAALFKTGKYTMKEAMAEIGEKTTHYETLKKLRKLGYGVEQTEKSKIKVTAKPRKE